MLGSSEEWDTVCSNLREFNAVTIPCSQKCIDWDVSDDEELNFRKKKRLSLFHSKRKPNVTKRKTPQALLENDELLETKPTSIDYTNKDCTTTVPKASINETATPKSPIFKASLNNVTFKSPVFKGSLSNATLTSPILRASTSKPTSPESPVFRVSRKSPVLKGTKNKTNGCIVDITNLDQSIRVPKTNFDISAPIVTNFEHFDRNDEGKYDQEISIHDVSSQMSESSYNSDHNSEDHNTNIIYEPSSPILKSRIKKRKHSTNNKYEPSSPLLKSRIKKRAISSASFNFQNSSTITPVKRPSCSKDMIKNIDRFAEPFTFHRDLDISQDTISNITKNISLYEYRRSDSEDLASCISNCVSPRPIANSIQNFETSTSSSDLRLSELHQSPLKKANTKKGSDWVKDIHLRGNEGYSQLCSPTKSQLEPLEAPDSSKKRIKKNGFAAQLKRLLNSWKSNISMWNHQMNLSSVNEANICSLSPDTILSQPESITPEFEMAQRFSLNSSCSSPLDRLNQGLKFVSPKQLSNKERKNGSSHKKFSSPLPLCVKNLRSSLEIKSPSQSPAESTGRANFTLPKKHLCVKILKIEWETNTMRSAICQEIDGCSLGERKDISEAKSRLYFGVFGCLETQPTKRVLGIGDKIKIFTPWQVLQVKDFSLPTLFSSYFVIQKPNAKSLTDTAIGIQEHKLTKVASWECSCSMDSHSIPSTCLGGCLKIHRLIPEKSSLTTLHSKCNRSFSTVRDFPFDSSPKRERYWTVLEAIEQCGSMADIPVSITIRMRRIYPMKNFPCSAPSHYWVLGQDPNGVFLLIEVPNRPLKSTLNSLLQGSEGRLCTITHLSMAQRLTDSQNPGLFSVISSLQKIYNQAIAANNQLLPLLKDQLKKPTQSFCYKFTANLGQTLDIKIAEKEGIDMSLPNWSLEEALQLKENGIRGCVTVIILYYVDPYLYVTCNRQRKPLKDIDSAALSSRVHRITIRNSVWFPSWVQENGTVMTLSVIKDISLWHGCLALDEFSRIQRIKNELNVCLQDVLKIIPELQQNSVAHDLVVVSGSINYVNEEEACSWEECCVCGGQDLYKISVTNIKCQVCETENVTPIPKYALEVGVIHSNFEVDWVRIRVKLFHTTIKNLVRSIPKMNNQYQAGSLFGIDIGPLMCIVRSVEEKRAYKLFLLQELPY